MNHFTEKASVVLPILVITILFGFILWIWFNAPIQEQELEEVSNARFVKYSEDGMEALDYDLVIDMETGVQYMITDYGITPLLNPDGTPIVTVE